MVRSILIGALVMGMFSLLIILAIGLARLRVCLREQRLARERHAARQQELEQELPRLVEQIAAARPTPPLFRPKGYLSPDTREQWGTQYGRLERRRERV